MKKLFIFLASIVGCEGSLFCAAAPQDTGCFTVVEKECSGFHSFAEVVFDTPVASMDHPQRERVDLAALARFARAKDPSVKMETLEPRSSEFRTLFDEYKSSHGLVKPSILAISHSRGLHGTIDIFRRTGIGAHYLISPDGKVTQLLSPDKRAWFCGLGKYDDIEATTYPDGYVLKSGTDLSGYIDINSHTISVILIYEGDSPAYTSLHTNGLMGLIHHMVKENFPIGHIAAISEFDSKDASGRNRFADIPINSTFCDISSLRSVLVAALMAKDSEGEGSCSSGSESS